MTVSVFDVYSLTPHCLEIPPTHSFEKNAYIKTTAPTLFPDLPPIEELQYIVFESMALVFKRCPNDAQRASGSKIAMPSCIALVLAHKTSGRYRIQYEQQVIEEFYYSQGDISDYRLSIGQAQHDGSTIPADCSFIWNECEQSTRQSLSVDACKSFLAEHQSQGFGLAKGRMAKVLSIVAIGFLILSAVLGIVPQMREKIHLEQQLRELQQEQSQLQDQVAQALALQDSGSVDELQSSLAQYRTQPIVAYFLAIAESAPGGMRITGFNFDSNTLHITIEYPRPLELQQALIDSREFSSVSIERISESAGTTTSAFTIREVNDHEN